MSKFTTRVELHAAIDSDYKRLHEEMKKEGFTTTISLAGENIVWKLPTAEYNYESEKTTEDVLELAKKAAARTGKKHSVLVTKADGRRHWYNLEKV